MSRTDIKVLKGNKTNLKTIISAAKNGRLLLMSCRLRTTGEPVDVLCALNITPPDADGNTHEMVPLATLFNENPFDLLDPPE